MAETYSPNLALTLIGTGDLAGTWGNVTNTNLGTLLEQSISGFYQSTPGTGLTISGSNLTLSMVNGASCAARNMYLPISSVDQAGRSLILPGSGTAGVGSKLYFISNNSAFAVNIVCAGGGTSVSLPAGSATAFMCDGQNILNAINYLSSFTAPSFSVSGTLTANIINAAGAITGGSINTAGTETSGAIVTGSVTCSGTVSGTTVSGALYSGSTQVFPTYYARSSGLSITNNSSTPTDPAFTLTLPVGTYVIDGLFVFGSSASGLVMVINAGTAVVANVSVAWLGIFGAASTTPTYFSGTANSTLNNISISNSSLGNLGSNTFKLSGTFSVTTAGTVLIQWGQFTSSATATTIIADSFVSYKSVA
jgi:hypothetical protein